MPIAPQSPHLSCAFRVPFATCTADTWDCLLCCPQPNVLLFGGVQNHSCRRSMLGSENGCVALQYRTLGRGYARLIIVVGVGGEARSEANTARGVGWGSRMLRHTPYTNKLYENSVVRVSLNGVRALLLGSSIHMSTLFTGHKRARGSEQEVFQKPACQVGSGQGVSEISRVGRVHPDPTRSVKSPEYIYIYASPTN